MLDFETGISGSTTHLEANLCEVYVSSFVHFRRPIQNHCGNHPRFLVRAGADLSQCRPGHWKRSNMIQAIHNTQNKSKTHQTEHPKNSKKQIPTILTSASSMDRVTSPGFLRPCPAGRWAMPGSVGSGGCLPLKNCTEADVKARLGYCF